MTKDEYFKYAIKEKLYRYKSWVIGVFGIVTDPVYINNTNDEEELFSDKPIPERKPVLKVEGTYKAALVDGEYVKIDNSKIDEPIAWFKDPITLTPEDLPNVREKTETTYGRFLMNAIMIVEAFHDKFDYVNEEFVLEKLNSKIVDRLEDDIPLKDRDPTNKTKLYVDEYIRYMNALSYIDGFTQVCVLAGSEKTILPPTGLKEFKKNLLKAYEGKLNDPVQLVAFENELKEFDKKYLKDDPNYGLFMSGKALNVSRKKVFLNVGTDGTLKDTSVAHPVINSLEEGWPLDRPEEFVDLMNSARIGGYGRGAETVNGGVVAKTLLRLSNNYQILDEDCGATKGIPYYVNESNIKNKVGRQMLVKNQWIEINDIEQIKPYLGKIVIFRSPMYCKSKGDRICKHCAGKKLSINLKGVASALTELSDVVLMTSMKKSHGTVMAVTKLNLEQVFT